MLGKNLGEPYSMKTTSTTTVLILLLYMGTAIVSSDDANTDSPTLKLSVTNDVTFTCNMAAFPGRLGKLVAMQIVRDADGQGQTTLATADATGLSVMSPHLTTTRSLAIVRGGLQTNRRQSWLTLRMADAGASDYGDYSCRISYLEHPADTPPTIRQTDVISLGPHTASSSGSEQFRLTVTKGLDMSCSVPRDGNASFADSVKIFTEDTNVSVADWSREEAGQSIQNETSKNTRILQEHEVWEEDRGIFRAHLWDMSCVDEGNYLCSVEYRNKNVVRSPAQELPVDDCSSTPTSLPAGTDKTASRANKDINFTRGAKRTGESYEEKSRKTWLFAIMGTMLCSLACVAVFGVIRWSRKRKRSRRFHSPGDGSVVELMTMTGTPPRITNASSVVDLQAGRQCADNESLPLDTDGTNDTTSQAECLLTRETSLSASRLELSADLHQRLDVFESASMCESVANDTTEAGEQATMPGTLHECDRFSLSGRLPCTVEDDDFAMSYCV